MASSKIPYEGPCRHEILLLISRWNEAHHSADHIIAQPPSELDIAIIDSLKTLDRERVLKDKAEDTDLQFLVSDIELIRKVNTERDWDKVNWERVDRGIETLKKVRKVWGKGVNYVAPMLPPRKSELRGGGEAWVTQSEDLPLREAINREKEKLSLAEERPWEQERQSDLRESDQKVERNTEVVLKMISQLMLPQKMKEFKEIFAGGRNQDEIERVAVLRPEGPAKLLKPTANVPNQMGAFYQAPFRPQTSKDQHHSKPPVHQPPVPSNQVRPRSPVHQRPVHVIQALKSYKIPVHQKQVNLNTPSSQDLHKRGSHQQLRTPASQNLHKAASHQHLQTTTGRTDPKGPANQQNPQNQHSTPHVPCPKKKVTFYDQSVELIPLVSHQNRPKSNVPAQKGTFYQQPTEANDIKDPTKDPANKVMFNKRPRVATDLKELRMQKAQDESRALASELRRMEC
jgi:hypothetical protein